jgi:hypothetical protein
MAVGIDRRAIIQSAPTTAGRSRPGPATIRTSGTDDDGPKIARNRAAGLFALGSWLALPYSCLPRSEIIVLVRFSLRSKFSAIQAYRSAIVRCTFEISRCPDLANLAYLSASFR